MLAVTDGVILEVGAVIVPVVCDSEPGANEDKEELEVGIPPYADQTDEAKVT